MADRFYSYSELPAQMEVPGTVTPVPMLKVLETHLGANGRLLANEKPFQEISRRMTGTTDLDAYLQEADQITLAVHSNKGLSYVLAERSTVASPMASFQLLPAGTIETDKPQTEHMIDMFSLLEGHLREQNVKGMEIVVPRQNSNAGRSAFMDSAFKEAKLCLNTKGEGDLVVFSKIFSDKNRPS